jgi:antirestriction protein ArdC
MKSSVQDIKSDLENGEGLYEPIIVAYDPNNGYAIVAEGNHRVEAAIQAGQEFVPVVVVTGNVSTNKNGEATPGLVEKTPGSRFDAEMTREVNPYFIFPDSDILGESGSQDVDLDQDAPALQRVSAYYELDDFVLDPEYGPLTIISPDGALKVTFSRSTYRDIIYINIEDADNNEIAWFDVSENSDVRDLFDYVKDVLSEEGLPLAAGQELDNWFAKDLYFAPEGVDVPSTEDSRFESAMRRYADSSMINLWLRGSINETPTMVKDVANLDDAFERFGEFFEGQVYRGVLMDTSEWDSQNLQFGQVITDPGYMSTSKDFYVAERFSRDGSESNRSIDSGKTRVVYVIDLYGKSKSLDLDGKFKYPEEKEVLLKRGMSFRVMGIEEAPNSNQKIVTIREIPSQSSPDLDQGLPGIAESDNDLSASSLQRRSNEIFDRLRADFFFTPRADPVSVKKSEIPAIAARDVESNKSVVASVLQEVKDAFKSPASWIKNFTNRDRQTPVHPLSKQEYKAFNLVALSAAADKAGYSDPRWLTKAEAEKSYGAKLNPDATPTMIAVPVLHSYEDENGNKFETVRFTPAEVYNAEQFSGMPAYEAPETVEYTPQEAFEVILDRFNRAEIERKRRGAPPILGMKIDDTSVNPDTGRPIRSPNYSKDRVKLPLRSQFKSDEAWIQSLAHELIHSTGALTRQNRSETREAGTDSTQRAREEVIAEMASAMLMKMFGLNYDTKNSAAYVKTQALKRGLSDEDLTDAAIKAQAAVDYMLGNDLEAIPKWDPTTNKRPQTPTEFRNTELTPLQSSTNPDTSQASIEALSLPEVDLDQDVSSSDKAKQKVYDALLEKLAKLGNSIAPWRKPFKDGFEFTGGSGIPRNPSSKRLYSGFNSFWLKIAAMSEDYTDSRWMTYNQAKDMGGQVRKGEKGVPILVPVKFMVTKDKEGKPLLDRNGKETGFSKLYFKSATVFNVSQIDGLNLPDDKPSTEMTPVESQDFIIDRYGKSMKAKGLTAPTVDYSYVGDYSDHASSPNWSPFDDRITLPGLAQFNSPEEIFDTIMHELTHSTGHRRRLDRSDLLSDYGNPNGQARAQEELIAEMGAAILGEMFGVNYDVDNTQAYMQSWFSVLKNGNPELLQIAASKAQQAVDYMLGMDLGDWSPLDGYNTYLGKQGQGGDEE